MPNLRPIELILIAAVFLIIAAVVYVIVRAAVAGAKTQPSAQASTPGEPLESRLAELSDLHSRGVISEDEYQSARASALQQG